MPPKGYQPTKAELKEDIDLLGLSMEEVRERITGPLRFEREPDHG